MKIALTFLTLAVVLLLASLMWGMKTYTDLAHQRSTVDRLERDLAEYRQAALYGINPLQPAASRLPVAAPNPGPIPPAEPAISEAELEARLEQMFVERLGNQQQEDQGRVNDLEAEIRAMELVAGVQSDELKVLKTERERIDPRSLSDTQNKIASLSVLAKVTKSESKHGFVVLDAGTNKNINVGQQFSLRQGHLVIGKIRIASVEEFECIADIVKGSVPVGAEIKTGDEVVDDFIGS